MSEGVFERANHRHGLRLTGARLSLWTSCRVRCTSEPSRLVPRRRGAAVPGLLLRGAGVRVGVHPAVDADARRGSRAHAPRTAAYVLAPVHRSYMDTPISSCLTRRRLRFMGKDTLWKRRLAAWLLSALGGFPVTRGTADREALRRCIAVLEAGEPLVLFPEGERKSGPVVQPMFDGAAYVALQAGVPIVPVGIGGSERVMPKGAKVHPPAQGARDRRRRRSRCRPTARAGCRARSPGDQRRSTSACSSCSTRPPRRPTLQQSVRRRRSRSRPRDLGLGDQMTVGGAGRPAVAEGAARWRVGGAAQLAGRVHRELRDADVDGGDAEAGGGERSDRRAARACCCATRTAAPAPRRRGSARSKQRGGVGVGGVALVGVDLDRRAVVDERGVVGIVALGVVRVHGVGVVGRDAARRGERAVQRRRGRRRRPRSEPLEHRLEERPDCAARATPTRPPRGRTARRRRRGRRASAAASAAVAAQHDTWLSRRPLASSEPSAPSTAGRLDVVQHELPRHDVGRPPGPLGEPVARTSPRRARRPTPGAR